MAKPKGKIPSLLSQSTGKPSPHICKKKTPCTKCKIPIAKDESCFTIPKVKQGFPSNPIYCIDCVQLILDQTKRELSEIESIVQRHKSNGTAQ